MKPEYNEYLTGSTRWCGKYIGIFYELCHHGVSEYQPEGIWCAYIYIYEDEAKDFNKFFCPDEIYKFIESSPYRIKNDYYNIPDCGFKGGITFYENGKSLNHKTGKFQRYIKIGCDYNHSWDADNGYPDTLKSVRNDTKKLIQKYIDANYEIGQIENDK